MASAVPPKISAAASNSFGELRVELAAMMDHSFQSKFSAIAPGQARQCSVSLLPANRGFVRAGRHPMPRRS
jgi:hypothetical protein